MNTRLCGKIHPEGVPCTKSVFYEDGCCTDKVYDHPGPHEHYTASLDEGGVITKRWEEQLHVVDLPFDSYRPWSDEDIAAAEKAEAG